MRSFISRITQPTDVYIFTLWNARRPYYSHSGVLVFTREDDTVVVKYPDGASFVQYRDGTRMMAKHDRSTWRIEKRGYYPVQYRNGTLLIPLPDGLTVMANVEQQEIQVV